MESIASKRYDVVVIGGGQAGLAIGHFLAQRGFTFVILDAGKRTGDSWRNRWDSLTLFTPARYSALPGLRFPAEPDHFPHKDEVANYLEDYAHRFSLPVLHEQQVLRLRHISEWRGFAVETRTARFEADYVVIATGPFHTPLIPQVANAIGKNVVQIHSSQYRSPDQLPDGDVMVIGGGNSGVQIAAELAQTRRTWLSVGEKLPALPDRVMHRSVFWWLDTLGMMRVSVHSPLGKRASQRDFLIGKSVKTVEQEDSVRLTGRAVGAEGNVIFTSDGAAVEAATVIWATGFRQDFTWVNADVFGKDARPVQRRGVTAVPGLYFLGLPWQHTRGSALLGWVGRDADYLARQMG